MIIEPCCCQNQLPKLAELSLSEGRTVAYHTNGDVTIQKLLFAVACLTGNESILTLIVPKLDVLTARYINMGAERKWWTRVRILSTSAVADVRKELPALNSKTLQVVEDKRISTTSQMLILEGTEHRIALTGYHPCVAPVDSGQPYRQCQHTLLYTPADTNLLLWDELTKIPLTPLRLHK